MAQKPVKIIRENGGDNNVLVTKSEINDFTCESVLIVDQSQQALIYKDGRAEGPFSSGSYTLPTNNISKLRAFFAKLFLKSVPENRPITLDVFFVNTVNDCLINWGTPSRIMVKDPIYNELVNVGANGSVKIKVIDPLKFVLSVTGRIGGYTVDAISSSVRSEVLTVVKTYIAELIVNQNVSLLEIHTKLLDLSAAVESRLNVNLKDYGLKAVHLNISDISVDESSKARLLNRQDKINARSDVVLDSKAQTDADYARTVRMADAKARERELQGYTYQEEKYWETQQKLAQNANFNPYFSPNPPPYGTPPMGYPYKAAVQVCAQCGNRVQPNAAFCAFCGARVAKSNPQDTGAHKYVQHNTACPHCGFPMLPRSSVCPNCGFDTESGSGK